MQRVSGRKLGIHICGVPETQGLAFFSLAWHFIPAIDFCLLLSFLTLLGVGDASFYKDTIL